MLNVMLQGDRELNQPICLFVTKLQCKNLLVDTGVFLVYQVW